MSLSQKLCIDHNEDDDELSSLSSTSSSFSQIHSKDQASITTAAATYSVGNERSKNTATLPSPLLSTSAASSFHSPTGRQRAIKLESSVYPQQTQPNTNVASSRLMSRVSGLSRDTHSDPSLISLAGAGGANENETITRVGSFCGSVSTNGPSMVSPSYTSKLVATHHSLGSSATLKQSRKPQKLGSLEISRQSLSSLGGGSTDSSDHGLRSSFLFNQGSSPHHLQSSVGTIPFRGVASGVTRNSVPEIRRRCLNDISCRLVSVTRNGEGLCLQNDLEATPSLPRQEKTLSQKGVTRHSNDSITLSAHSEGVYGTDSHCFHELNPNTNTTQTKATNTVKGRQRYRRGVNNSSRLYVQDNMDDEEYDDGFRVNLDSREESFNSYDDEHGTEESPTEDDPDSFMNELFLRRGNVTSPVDKTTMIENTTVWYPNGGQSEDDRPRELGPYGLIIRQIRNGQMEKWQDLESLPIENKRILNDEDVAFELERVRLAAQNDMKAILDVASDLWEKTFLKANDLDRLLAENNDLELQIRLHETTIRGLEDKVSANALLWQNKFKSALEELTETEQKLLASKQNQRVRHMNEIDDGALTGENMYEGYLENLQLIQTLKGEKADLKRALAEATAQLLISTKNLQELENVNTEYQSLRNKYSQIYTQLAQAEKQSSIRLEAIEELEERIMSLQELLNERQKDLDELTQHLNDQRGLQMEDDDLGQTMGVSLLKELLNQQKGENQLQSQDPLPPIAEDPEPRELTRVAVFPVVIVDQGKEKSKPELTPYRGQSVELNPARKEMMIYLNDKGRIDIPPAVKEVVNEVTETVDSVNFHQTGNQIHIHLHQHTHNHHHSHSHNHEHYHSYGRTLDSVMVDDNITSPLLLAKSADDDEQTSTPPKNPTVWSRVRIGQHENSKEDERSEKGFGGHHSRLQVVGGTRLYPTRMILRKRMTNDMKISNQAFVNQLTNQLEEGGLVDENRNSTCSTYGTTKVKARLTESRKTCDKSPQNFASVFMDGVIKMRLQEPQTQQSE